MMGQHPPTTGPDPLALRPGDVIRCGGIRWVVLNRPRRIGGRPVMIPVRPEGDPTAIARLIQHGAHRWERV